MAIQAHPRLTEIEYLRLEREGAQRHEYFAGEIFAMAGATERHNLIVSNLVVALGSQFKGRPCRVYSSDMRMKVSATGLLTYPDVVAVCGELQVDDEIRDTLLNPAVIVEVLSASTEGYDRVEKFAHYRKVPSLQDYVLVSQQAMHVEHYRRQPGEHWLLTDLEGSGAVLELASVGAQVGLGEAYDKVEF